MLLELVHQENQESTLFNGIWEEIFQVFLIKRTGGVVIGSIIAPIFFNTAEDSGCLPIQANVDSLETGDVIVLKPYAGVIEKMVQLFLNSN